MESDFANKPIQSAGWWESWNGLFFGFQPTPDDLPSFYICHIDCDGTLDGHDDNTEERVALLRDKLGYSDKQVWSVDWIGREFLVVAATLWNDIPRIINTAISSEVGLVVATHSKAKVQFKNGDTFSLVECERKHIAFLEEMLVRFCNEGNDYARVSTLLRLFTGGNQVLKHWNWTTPEGKAFCSRLRTMKRCKRPLSKFSDRYYDQKFEDVCAEHGILHHGSWSRYAPSGITVDDLIGPGAKEECVPRREAANDNDKKRARESSGDDDNGEDDKPAKKSPKQDGCQVCMERPADTMVLPCNHVVVCKECSNKLASDALNASLCVYCRQPIELIIADDADPRKPKYKEPLL